MPPTGCYICTYICIIIQSITYLFTMYIHLITIYWPWVQFNIARYYQNYYYNKQAKGAHPTINYTLPVPSSSMRGVYFHTTISRSRWHAAFTSGKSTDANSPLLSCYHGNVNLVPVNSHSNSVDNDTNIVIIIIISYQ